MPAVMATPAAMTLWGPWGMTPKRIRVPERTFSAPEIQARTATSVTPAGRVDMGCLSASGWGRYGMTASGARR